MVCGWVRGNEPCFPSFTTKRKLLWKKRGGEIEVFAVSKRDTSSSVHVSIGIVQLGCCLLICACEISYYLLKREAWED